MASRILIVDDEANHRVTLSLHLRSVGFEVVEASEGVEAIERLHEAPVDLVVADLMMPGMSGLELTRQLRLRWPGIPVVLISAYHLSREQLERAGVGAVGFVPKPYDVDEMVSFLRAKLLPTSAASL